ncbi:MAG: maleylpyruvate isomerase family mycothiol-dependent enzyme, partial [Pseudonocardiaceae bacterium]
MTPLRDDRYLDALAAQSALLTEALRGTDLQQRVPTCPEWTLYQLAEHVGQAHRGVTELIIRRSTAPPDFSTLRKAAAPEDPDKLGTWLRDGASELVGAIRAAGPRTPVWSWTDDQSVGFWTRRMAHETAVHRADVELALGRVFALDTDLAADAISEWLGAL